ncbi:MAG TPA: MG2 domain-containing protein, partial [Thermoanaerobaculia bacterium]|nr:MG2 domain-containing protein [Thermoanaerobaculia bacterium]
MLSPRRRALVSMLGFAFAAATLVLTGSTTVSGQAARPGKAAAPRPTPSGGTLPDWKEIDRLVSDQKFEEAANAAARRREAAQKAGDEADWTKALIREVQLRTGLHGYETAVRFLKDQPWPQGLLSKTALELFYAQSLVNYFHVYSWEIQQRERVESTGTVDLKAWTGPQIYAEAVRGYLRVWKERNALGQENVKALNEFLEPNDYPRGVRGTLRDAVAYLFAAHLADSSSWSAAQSNEVFRLDLPSLLRSDSSAKTIALDDDAVHPLARTVSVLDDLEVWHASRGEREGALEARLERLRRLFVSFTEEEDRRTIEKDLEERLQGFAGLPWFAMGKAQLAEFVERPDLSGDLVWARSIAEQGRKAYPGSVGGQRCLAIVKRIEAPEYQLRTMQNDGPGRRSIQVSHKNIERLLFRALPLDLAGLIEAAHNQYAIFPNGDELRQIVDTQTPAAEWSAQLPPTPDYRLHATYVTPPMKEPGAYVVAVSGAASFGGPGFPLVAAHFILSDLVLVTRPVTGDTNASSFLEVQALSGETGQPVQGVEATVLRTLWNPERIERISSATTGAGGLARLPFGAERPGGGVFLFARHGRDLGLDMSLYFPYGSPQPSEVTSSLLFTDRSIYRPLQKIFWKVLGYRGDPRAGRFEVLPASPVTVTLYDQNNQKVDERLVTTTDFGSAAGEFVIPAGRALGAWRLGSSLGGAQTSVRVEEYKRPTFEVTWKDPAQPLRLNQPARLTGEARYYFGLPVASGSVRWRVTRTPQYFWWSYWSWYPNSSVRAQTVAAGVSSLQPDGTFEVAFTPGVDERLGKGSRELTYSYRVDADASDEGGETRSASRSFRLGFVSVEARVDAPPGFLLESRPGRFRVVRTNLDGVPRAGHGSFRIVTLEQPGKTMLPADQPVSGRASTKDTYRTPGDAMRPRWDTEYSPERMIRLWKDGAEVARGELVHDAKGEASMEVPGLPAGAYRLLYRTVDDFGAVFEMPREFLVGGRKTPLAVPVVLSLESASVPVGGTARLLVASGLPDQALFFDIYRAGRRVERRTLSDKSPSLIEIPVGEKDRGGFSVKLSGLRDHQLMTLSQSVFVPWDDKELTVSFATFRDKLRPGARETWKVKVEGPKASGPEKAAAELLAYMYDRSLDAFVGHFAPSPLSVYPNRTGVDWSRANLGEVPFQYLRENFPSPPASPYLRPDGLKFYGGYAIGGPGQRGMASGIQTTSRMAAPASANAREDTAAVRMAKTADEEPERKEKDALAVPLRSAFAETAFWQP